MGNAGHDSPEDTRRQDTIALEGRGDVSQASSPGSEETETSGKDRKVLASRDRDIQRAKKVLSDTPDFRQERIAAMRIALKAGTLNLRGEDIAEKLLGDVLLDNDSGA